MMPSVSLEVNIPNGLRLKLKYVYCYLPLFSIVRFTVKLTFARVRPELPFFFSLWLTIKGNRKILQMACELKTPLDIQ